ncbi:hypothetical protein AURDEDRAFT_170206 [Auricularia subglabra TFB-10046 SS5]|nr:hypothetical protein AURDEDRAFT_170206 [Auricularia subglabra TFB-10046 SS5]
MTSRWEELQYSMVRLTSLTLFICSSHSIGVATLSSPAFWNGALEVLSVPANHLECFSLTVTEPPPRYVPYVLFGNDDDDIEPAPQCIAYNPLPLSSTIFAGHAPRLRTCTLEGAGLPLLDDTSTTFQHITCFSYSQNLAIHVDDIARMLTLMPALVNLGLCAPYLDSRTGRSRSGSGGGLSGRLCTSVRNLVLRAEALAPEALCGIIDFQTLSYIEMYPSFDAGPLITAAYAAESMELVVFARTGIKIVVNARTTIHAYYTFHGFHRLMAACSRATSILLHEFEWNPEPWTTIPPMPAVTSLGIRLATCAEHAQQVSLAQIGSDSVGLFQASGCWELASLKHLHFTAPYNPAGTCGFGDCGGRCSRGVSISLRDIAAFVRNHIQFDAQTLDRIQLSGFRVVDPDFGAAQGELLALTKTLRLVELPDRLPCMDIPKYEDLPVKFAHRFS